MGKIMQIKKIILMLLTFMAVAYSGAFDDRYPSPRAMAMSNAFVAVANDAWAPWYNPAGLAQIQNYQAGFAYQKPFSLSFFNTIFATGVVPINNKYGTVSVFFENFGVKYRGNDLNQEYTAGISHGFFLLSDIHTSLSVGYSIKYYHMKLSESVGGLDLGSGGTLGFDAGIQASIYKRTYLGLYVYNLNAPTIGVDVAQELPRRVVIGAAYKPYTGLTTSIAVNKPIGLETQYEAGFEFQLLDMLSLRAGTSTQPSRFSAGLGIEFEGLNFDYAFQTHPVLSETHSFGLVYSW